ncbi:hypothetical protein [Ramlibacter alkalitolerans]|uniref:DUF4265 domain-containing protein n=1 Tax=Ramlibacter alkalitolerans TaxID=2039631 RepID=A0ABS1JLF4_9BURK|nr:hypothetical protein [Ramlibacter alkalitolerans]MBL0425062.1 hypothetical protein [Ramlibacter alkalitolerans]
MRTNVYLSELLDAHEFVSAGTPFEHAAYVSRETGRIFWDTEDLGLGEELPEDVKDGTLYACVPHKHDLDLGQRLVFRFIEANAPEAYEQVRGYFSRRGAYARFKDLLERRGLLEAWYSYEQQACEAALREWAESENLELVAGQRAGD